MSIDALTVNEIFFSIQGESTHAGKPCVFIRLTGCNLRCEYCDTTYAYEDGKSLAIHDIISAVAKYDCKTIEITGGEPLMQENTIRLLRSLCDLRYEVLLETNGSRSLRFVDPRVIKIMDVKTPGSGMDKHNCFENLQWLTPQDEVKFIITGKRDYEWAVDVIRKYPAISRTWAVLFSPSFAKAEPQQLADWMIADRLQSQIPHLRFQLQIHKYIWPPDMRGK